MILGVLIVYGGTFFILGVIGMMSVTNPKPMVRTPNRVRSDTRVKRHAEMKERYW